SPLLVRGLSPQAASVALEDYLLREPILGFVNPNNIPINLIERLGFRGVGRFGPFGVQSQGGHLAIDPYRFEAGQPYSQVIFRAGDFGYSDIGLTLGLPVSPKVNFLMLGSRQEFDGFQINRQHTGGKLFSRISYDSDSDFELDATSILSRSDVDIPALILPDFIPLSNNAKRKESRFDQVLSARFGKLSNTGRQLSTQVFFSRVKQESTSDSLLFDNENWSVGSRAQYEINTSNTRWTVGAELSLDDLSSKQLRNHTDGVGSLFGRWNRRMAEKMSLGTGIRLEKKSSFGVDISPSLVVDWYVSAKAKVFLAAQRNKRYPSFAERYWPTDAYRGNADLKPETSRSLEVGLDLDREDKVKLRTALFVTGVQDWIGGVMIGDSVALAVDNLGDRTVSGVDLQFIWNPSPRRGFGIITNYLRVQESGLEKQLQVPEYSVYSYAELGQPLFQGYVFVKLRVAARLFGKRYGFSYSASDTFPTVTSSGPDAVLDGRLSFQFSDAKLVLSMENLLDRRYQLVPAFFMPPRTFRLTIAWEFWD
ncbi:TonB-dependent receptor, partial [bacterium]|nr:TonB-dependent receptor [bacterium]